MALVQLVTMMLLLVAVAFGLHNPSPRQKLKEQRVFELQHGQLILGSKKAKKRIMNAASKTAKDLSKLLQLHKSLEQQIEALNEPKRHFEEAQLKHLKRKKLAVRDASVALRARVKHDNDIASLEDKIGYGGFADVLLGHQILLDGDDLQTKEPVAVKITRKASDSDALLREARFVRALHPYPGFVRVEHVERISATGNAVLVLNLLGPSLEDLWWSCTCGAGGLSAQTVLRIADHMVSRLDALRRVGIAHRDIQPANILMGLKNKGTPHLIDFGIAAEMGGTELKEQPTHAFSGTPRFSSVSALSNHGGGNRAVDDLESLCYTLAFLRSGTVPWSEQSEEDAMEDERGARALAIKKAAIEPNRLCGKALIADPAAKAIGGLLEHARECNEPDYTVCHAMVRDELEHMDRQEIFASSDDWERHFVTWSDDDGVLKHTLYG